MGSIQKYSINRNKFTERIYKYLIVFLAVFILTGYFSIASKGYIEYRYNQSDQPETIRNTIIQMPIAHSDGSGYYSYLPHYLINEDIADGKYFGFANPLSKPPIMIKYNIGVAVMILPFFLIAHLISWIFGFPTDGVSFFYQHAAGLAGIFFCLLGLI